MFLSYAEGKQILKKERIMQTVMAAKMYCGIQFKFYSTNCNNKDYLPSSYIT